MRSYGLAYRLIYLILFLMISTSVMAIFVRSPGINIYYRAMVGDMIYGNAYKPFVCRTLVPTTTRFITAAIPEKARDFLCQSAGRSDRIDKIFAKFGWEKEYLIEYSIVLVLMFLSLSLQLR